MYFIIQNRKMKNYILLWVCLWCAGQLCAETAASKSLDINIVGHVLDKNTREHLPYISVVLKGTTIGVMHRVTIF